MNFLVGPEVKNLPGNAGDMGSIPDPGRFHCHKAAKPVHHNHWSLIALEPVLHNKEATTVRSLHTAKCSNRDPAQPPK